jgi:hypothetical protein
MCTEGFDHKAMSMPEPHHSGLGPHESNEDQKRPRIAPNLSAAVSRRVAQDGKFDHMTSETNAPWRAGVFYTLPRTQVEPPPRLDRCAWEATIVNDASSFKPAIFHTLPRPAAQAPVEPRRNDASSFKPAVFHTLPRPAAQAPVEPRRNDASSFKPAVFHTLLAAPDAKGTS